MIEFATSALHAGINTFRGRNLKWPCEGIANAV